MIDFILSNTGSSSQVAVGLSDEQHIGDLIAFCKGWHKFSPFVGACLYESLSDEQTKEALQARIRTELTEDGATVQEIDFMQNSTGQITLKTEATYG